MTVKCPNCDKYVCIGMARPVGIVQHQGKKPCKKAWQAKEAKHKICTLFQVGVTKVKVLLAGDCINKLGQLAETSSASKTECKGCKL